MNIFQHFKNNKKEVTMVLNSADFEEPYCSCDGYILRQGTSVGVSLLYHHAVPYFFHEGALYLVCKALD